MLRINNVISFQPLYCCLKTMLRQYIRLPPLLWHSAQIGQQSCQLQAPASLYPIKLSLSIQKDFLLKIPPCYSDSGTACTCWSCTSHMFYKLQTVAHSSYPISTLQSITDNRRVVTTKFQFTVEKRVDTAWTNRPTFGHDHRLRSSALRRLTQITRILTLK